MLVDTHCHLDASEFDHDRDAVVARAVAAGVTGIVIPAICRANFHSVRTLAHSAPGLAYALGIHPLCAGTAQESDLDELDTLLTQGRDDPKLVAIGEIGLDHFVPSANTPALRERQAYFYRRQLELAQRHDLPVLLHVRRSQDELLKQLRRHPRVHGIAHAFNGSFQQAQQFLSLGFVLGIGGAMTFARALQIRRLASSLPASALVLETDAPDIPPAWLGRLPNGEKSAARNEPAEVAGVARTLAQLRQVPPEAVAQQCSDNAFRVLPRLARALAS
ncbi:MAG TPA: TatD family hydrolase [Castellaniella sp.]|uniref:TatD family hydrolase n=1 Tax=Castellaniella sp. TaxID=1955812 RepID=UPI002F15E3BD